MPVDFLDEPMAKKTAKGGWSTKKPDPSGRKPMVVQIRGSEEWKTWIEELASAERDTVAKFLERLAYRHAKSIGFREMPNR